MALVARFVISASEERLLYNLKHTLERDVDLFLVQGPNTDIFNFPALRQREAQNLADVLNKRTVTVVSWRDFRRFQSKMMVEGSAACIVGYATLQPLLEKFRGSAGQLWYVVPSLSAIDALSEDYAFDCVAVDIPRNPADFNIILMLQSQYTMTNDFTFLQKTVTEHVTHTEGLYKLYNHV